MDGDGQDQSDQAISQPQNGEKEFVICPKNGSDIASVKSLDEKSDVSLDYGLVGRINKSGHSSISSFSEVHPFDMEPTLGKTEHGDDVSALMADAQKDVDGSPEGSHDEGNISPMVKYEDQRWFSSVRKYSEFEEIKDSEVATNDSEDSDEATNSSVETSLMATDGSNKDAFVFYPGITYLGSASVNAPVSEIELKRTISIMRDHANISIDVILAVALSPEGTVRLIDPSSRADMATYEANKIIFWGKADEESREKDCVAFNVSHGDDTMYHCHVFKCAEEDIAGKILQSLTHILKEKRKQKQAANIGSMQQRLDPNNLVFKFDVTIDILEEVSNGTLSQVARDKSCFKLRENVPKRVELCLEQVTNKTLAIERCFGLLLSPGKNVDQNKMHLLDQVQMESRSSGHTNIISGTWNPTWPDMKVLNTETPKDTRVFISIAADLVFSDLKEPVRIVKESKVKVFPTNEKFWNPTKPRLHEEYTMELKENFLESGERYYELKSLVSASELWKNRHQRKSSETSSLLKKSKKSASFTSASIDVDDEPVDITGPDEEDDEPLLSGSGKIEKECSEEEVMGWSDILEKWKDQQTRPKQLIQLVRKGVPDPMRGQIWQMLADLEQYPEILSSYSLLTSKIGRSAFVW